MEDRCAGFVAFSRVRSERVYQERVSSPIHLFLSSTPVEKRCSRPALDVRRSEEWILSMKRFLLRDEEKNSIF